MYSKPIKTHLLAFPSNFQAAGWPPNHPGEARAEGQNHERKTMRLQKCLKRIGVLFKKPFPQWL